ncbi:MAG: hypothetical protein IPM14_08185 [bacterium]|nr:hypothetical protein [bacterium]
MITNNTVFILGAGASVPYGYPTAIELRKFIIKEFRRRYTDRLRGNNKSNEDDIRTEIAKYSYLIESFKQSSTKSFDLFLSRNKEKYYEQGKFILAWCILYFELMSKFNEDIERQESDWYTLIYNYITDDMIKSTDLEKFRDNKLNVITFNYDRSFEEFLWRSLFFSFSGDREDVTKISEWIKVFHAYGKIYDLQWEQTEKGEKYQTNKILDLADKAKENIQIIYDERNPRLEEIKKIIIEAERIFFLGFGYSKENIEAIGLVNIMTKHQSVFGTALNFTDRERIKVKSLLMKLNPGLPDHHIHIENLDCVGILREYL